MVWKAEYRVGVQAPADTLWDLMSNLDTWPSWNPLYRKAKGVIRIGELLTLEQHLPGQEPQILQPRVLDWAPRDHIHWETPHFRGLASGVRYIELEVHGEESCILSNGELYHGPLAGFLQKRRRTLRTAFTEMGEALKMKAEEVWAAEKASASSATPLLPHPGEGRDPS